MELDETYPVWVRDAAVELPERSAFYPLPPIGVGTAQVESLTGYVARLAEAHVLSVGDMIGREPLSLECAGIPHRTVRFCETRPKCHVFHALSYMANGFSPTAESWAEGLERTTSVNGLDLLTLLPLRRALSEKSLFKRYRNWCAQCYEEDRINGQSYERLLWSLRCVTICPRHRVRLADCCPFCNRALPPLAVRSRPGHCSACGKWLGSSKGQSALDAESYQLYVAAAVGGILSAMAQKGNISASRLRKNLRACLGRVAQGNALAIAELANVSRGAVRSWTKGETLPQIDVLVRFAFHIGIPVSELLMSTDLHHVDWTSITSRVFGKPRTAKQYRSSGALRKLMKAALHDDDCPSVAELAKKLGYKRPDWLHQVSPDLCRRLTKKHRACRRTHWWKVPGAKRIGELDRIRDLLTKSLEQDIPIPVRHIAAQLGYSNGGFIHRRFPDLCRTIAKRLEERKEQKLDKLRLAVTAALAEQPPPTLREMSRRLGFQTSTTLRSWVADLADQLLKRRADYEATEREELHVLLSPILQEVPAPSLSSVARRFQRSVSFLKEKHPDLCRAIASRHLRGGR